MSHNNVPFDVLSYPRAARIDQVAISPYQTRGLGMGALHGTDVLQTTMLVGSEQADIDAALEAGMGVVQPDGAQGVQAAVDFLNNPGNNEPLYEHGMYSDLSYTEVAEALFKPGEISIVGFVGRTGAGKSTSIRRLIEATHEIGAHGQIFEVDAFFKRSRQERKAWLNEEGITDEERTERRRVITWWDLSRTTATLERIRNGEAVHETGLYDMQKGGEMVGTLDIDPGDKGFTVFVEGTALLVPDFDDTIDSFVYLNTHDAVRTQSLMERNLRDGYTPEESRARKELTDAAETNEHIAKPLRQRRYTAGNLSVLDNTQRGTTLRVMPPYIPRK